MPMFSRIEEINAIRALKSELSEKERILTEPIMTDLDMISTLYMWFRDIVSEKEAFRPGNVSLRKKFLFIVLYLYSPSSLAGGKIRNGLRKKITEVLGLASETTLSDNRNGLVFAYRMYKYFRQDVERIYTEIVNRLKHEGIINQ
jgi:hypothetical protein